MVQNLVELNGDQVIDLPNSGIDHGLSITRDRNITFEHLSEKLLHQVFAPLPADGVSPETPFGHNLVQQTTLLHGLFRCRGSRSFFCLSHWILHLLVLPAPVRTLA